MRQTEFQIGDRCLFSFSGDKNVPVEVVGYYAPKEECVWVAPEDANKRIPYAVDKTIKGKMVITPGMLMKFTKFIQRFPGEKMLTKISYNVQHKRQS